VERTIAEVVDERGALDVLMNVAGVIQVGPAEHMTVEDFENAMATHMWGPLYAILAALPHLSQSATPRIVNVSSIGGKLAVPHLLPYSASKFALVGLSEGLRVELAARGIAVTTVCPGLMRTGSTYNASFKGHHRQEFAWFHTADAIPGISTDARVAARRIIEACRHGDPELVISIPAKMAIRLNALCPGTMAAALSAVSRLLPSSNGPEGNQARAGWQSVSRYAPSILTRAADRATAENNEVPAANVT
jgi:NAD(P)-dependent dehydrogenase (short-subunit alcohol dehydrogenase family)